MTLTSTARFETTAPLTPALEFRGFRLTDVNGTVPAFTGVTIAPTTTAPEPSTAPLVLGGSCLLALARTASRRCARR